MLTYRGRISRGLTKALSARATPVTRINLQDMKIIIFSDHHRGKGDGADDFKQCKQTYEQALRYYKDKEFHLHILGDGEELWERSERAVLNHYAASLTLEAEFHHQEKYTRYFGNHDYSWSHPKKVARHLARFFPGIRVFEGQQIIIENNGNTLGRLFLVHGHQGSLFSDTFKAVSRVFIRFMFAPIQQLRGKPLTPSITPSKNLMLREKHEKAIYDWAGSFGDLIVIAGHTHRPVFTSQTHAQFLTAEITRLVKDLDKATDAKKIHTLEKKIQDLSTQRKKVLAKTDNIDFQPGERSHPAYFNTGCCSFSDGDITGIEIEKGEIRLVWWGMKKGAVKREVRRKDKLVKIFKKLP